MSAWTPPSECVHLDHPGGDRNWTKHAHVDNLGGDSSKLEHTREIYLVGPIVEACRLLLAAAAEDYELWLESTGEVYR